MPQVAGGQGNKSVAEKIDERILRILNLKDTFDLNYGDYSSLLKEKLVVISMGNSGLSREEEMLIRDEFKRVKDKTGSFKGSKKKISASSVAGESKRSASTSYKSPFEVDREKQTKIRIKPNNKVTALSTYVEKQDSKKIPPGALVKSTAFSITKPIQEQSKKIAKVSNLLESTKKQEEKIVQEKRKEEIKEKDEQKKKDIESRLEKKIDLPSLPKLSVPILNPIKSIFSRIFEALGWLVAGWLVDKALVWISDPENKKKLESVGNWFVEVGNWLDSESTKKKISAVTDFLKNNWFLLFGAGGAMLLWSNGLVRFSAKLAGLVVNATVKLAAAAVKIAKKAAGAALKFAVKNPKVAVAMAGASAILYALNKDSVDKTVGQGVETIKGGAKATKEAIEAGARTTADVVVKTQEFKDAGDKFLKVGKYAEEKNTGGIIGLNSGGKVPVMLTRGEVVVPPSKAKQIGYDKLYAMNSLGNYRNDGGPIVPFNTGGGVKVVPGRGANVDTVRDNLPVGSFVLQRPAVDAMGGPKALRGYNQGGAVKTVAQYGTPQQRALLDTISFAEGTFTKNREEGYKIMFTGKRFQAPPWEHPRKINRSRGYKSDAAGRYQYLSTTWDDVARRVGARDFSPINQDKGALNLAEGRNKSIWSELNSKGLTNNIMNKMSGIWASFPTLKGVSKYGQPVKKGAKLVDFYNKTLSGAGPGVITSPPSPSGQTPGAPGTSGMENATQGVSSPMSFFGQLYNFIDTLKGKSGESTPKSGESKNYGGLIQGLNKGGLALLTSGGGTSKLRSPVKWGDLRPHHGVGDKTREYGITKDYILDGPGYPGLPVPTPVDAKVAYAGAQNPKNLSEGYGNMVELVSESGKKLALLGHFSRLNVKTGDKISAGTVLGLQGNTGRSTGPHVHIDATKDFHLAWSEYVLGNKNILSAESLSSDVSPVKPGEDNVNTSITPTSPMDFFGQLYNFIDQLKPSSTSEPQSKPSPIAPTTSSTSKLTENIDKVSKTPPSKTKPAQSTSSINTVPLPPDVVKSGKESNPEIESLSKRLPKPDQKVPLPSVPTNDATTITSTNNGFNWSYAEYFGVS